MKCFVKWNESNTEVRERTFEKLYKVVVDTIGTMFFSEELDKGEGSLCILNTAIIEMDITND